MIEHTLKYTIPAAYSLLPPAMSSPAASAMLLAIGLQESKFLARRQGGGGPARGFWQFETGGIAGVLKHPSSSAYINKILFFLRYNGANAVYCTSLVEDNDTLACVFARLLLWTLPDKLRGKDDPGGAWEQYIKGWRPGKPVLESWGSNYAEAWARVENSGTTGIV